MNVCIDIQAAVTQRAGVGRYTKALVQHMGRSSGQDSLALFYFDFLRKGQPFPVDDAQVKSVRWCPGRFAQILWRRLGFPPFETFAGSADLYHFPNFLLPPLRSGAAVVTIHDLSFMRMPGTTEARNLHYLRSKMADTVRRADGIITVSEFSAREITELLDVERDKVHVVHSGISSRWRLPAEDDVAAMRSALALQKPYMLTVGTIEPRKNLTFLVEMLEAMPDFDGELVIAGARGWKYDDIFERIASSSRAGDIRYVEYVPDEHMSALYGGADLFVFSSLYEGFGFPPLEAMACGTPVLSSPGGSLREVLGTAAVIMDEFDPEAWAREASAILHDPTLIRKGLEHAARFTWEKAAQSTWTVYRKVLAAQAGEGRGAAA